ncbi:MAG TPA: TolC family protein [Bryobacteraceae bacterium]|nr:TolC family protein [Bryobacteraceae bacterium]
MKAAVLVLGAAMAYAQTPLTLQQAVETAVRDYPSVRVSREQIDAAAAAIRLARTAYLPRVDALAQVNRATRNNLLGLLLPNSVIPSISGPVLGTNNIHTAWGSAVGVLVTWEPFDFGLRQASVSIAKAAEAHSEAELQRTRFEVASQAADAYLTVVAAQETVRAAQAGVDRAETVLRTINAQVNAELRPGADAARARAEVAAARTQLIQAQEAVEVAGATLSQFVGKDAAVISAPKLGSLPPAQTPGPVNLAANPIAVEQSAAVAQERARLRALERTYFPHFYVQGAAYARGTGAETNGGLLGGANGLAPNVQNYAAGLTVTFPVFDLPSIHAREMQQSATIRAEEARAQQIAVELRARWNSAVATLRGARNVAANTPVQVSAARAAVEQSTARYQAGLTVIDDVAEAQRLVTQAEIDDALARLGVWRALLGVAVAAGDITPFIAEAGE